MPPATDSRGCAGTWRLYDNWSGYPSYSGWDAFGGYELDNPQWQRIPGSAYGWQLIAAGTDNRVLLSTGGIGDSSSIIFDSAREFIKTDPLCQTSSKYDCVNGQCVFSSQYKTPGLYSTLAECQANCGNGPGCNPPNICAPPNYCPPGMVCIPSEEWNQIEPLSSAVRSKACG